MKSPFKNPKVFGTTTSSEPLPLRGNRVERSVLIPTFNGIKLPATFSDSNDLLCPKALKPYFRTYPLPLPTPTPIVPVSTGIALVDFTVNVLKLVIPTTTKSAL